MPISPLGIDKKLPDGTGSIQVHPNPFLNRIDIKLDVIEPTHTVLTVYDLKGRLISELINRVIQDGEFSMKWDGSNLESGVYILSATFNNDTQICKIIKK